MGALAETGIILITAAIAGITAYFCKQPLVLAYIIGGIIIALISYVINHAQTSGVIKQLKIDNADLEWAVEYFR